MMEYYLSYGRIDRLRVMISYVVCPINIGHTPTNRFRLVFKDIIEIKKPKPRELV